MFIQRRSAAIQAADPRSLAMHKLGVTAVRDSGAAFDRLGSKPESNLSAIMSALASCGHNAPWFIAAVCQQRTKCTVANSVPIGGPSQPPQSAALGL